jgi:hypothetical protein
MLRTRKELCAQELYASIKDFFSRKKLNSLNKKRVDISLADCLMSGLAIFSLKFPSLLQYDTNRRIERTKKNLKSLFGIKNAPCDTYMRERLDVVDPSDIRGAFKTIFAKVQRGKALEQYAYLDGKYLLSNDGTGHFSSPAVHCENCCVKKTKSTKKKGGKKKNSKATKEADYCQETVIDETVCDHEQGTEDGKVTYYHQMMGAVIVHPDIKQVIPLAPEAILKQDGTNKNDCERNASKRLLENIRRDHPHLKFIVVEDGLASNGPHIRDLEKYGMSYILGAKPGDHAFLFDWVKDHPKKQRYQHMDEQGTLHEYEWVSSVPLNDSNFDLKVNFLEYWETDKKGKKQHFSWVTDLVITKDSVYKIMRGGRARWHIENQTFNTLKNQGYHFEHNFGHGNKNLCTIMGFLMMLAFLVDQVQELTCTAFKKARKLTGRYSVLWELIKSAFFYFDLTGWDEVFTKIIEGFQRAPNTS